MNRIYRSVWNEISRTFVAAAETVRGRGKPSSGICTDRAMTLASRSGAVQARRRPMMLALEQRFMFDGAAVAPVADVAAAAEAHAAIAAVPAAVEVRAADPVKDGGKTEVVFVDTSVKDYKTLEAGIRDGVAIVEIDGGQDGLAQIAKWAKTHSGYDSISILGHGAQATLNLGTATVTESSLANAVVAAELAEVGKSLTADGDILLYGCDVAKGTDGEKFIADLAKATGADVAASTDLTGAAAKGGDWTLEKTVGSIESGTPIADTALLSYTGLLAADATFGFEANVSGLETKTVTETASGHELKVTTTSDCGYSGTAYAGMTLSGADSLYLGVTSYETSAKFTVDDGSTFTLASITLADVDTGSEPLIFTSNKGSITINLTPADPSANGGQGLTTTHFFDVSADANAAYFQGITSFTITTSAASGFDVLIDNVVVNNINPPTLTTPGTIVYSDHAAADTFSNQGATLTATISAVTSSPIASYGISGVTSGVSTEISGTSYDVSKAGTYGTLYVKSSTGAYVYVPNDTTINATSSLQSETFTVTATDAAGATGQTTLLISINGANDTPAITSGASASVAENTSGTVYTADASDRDAGQTPTYSLSGTDAGLFKIDPGTGEVSFNTKPNYELPGDAGGDNVYDINVVATDSGTGALSASKAVAISVTNVAEVPTTTVATATLSADTGSSSTDFITKTASQTISGTLSANLASGEKVQVSYDNGGSWSDATTSTVGSSSWSTTATLSGSNTFQARVTNADGSGSAYTHSYALDTTAPTTTLSNLALSNDTGSSNTDFITKNPSQTITATLSAAPAGGEVIYGSLDGGSSWTDITNKVSGTALTWNGVTLSGSNTLMLKVQDTAGNDGAIASHAFTLDTTAPTATIATLVLSNDTGVSSTDFITKTASQTVYGTLSANLASGETVQVSLDNGSSWTAATASVGSNSWSLAGQALSASSTLKVKVSDAAGNDGSVFAQAYVLDTTAPTIAFSTTRFSADTGSSSTDLVTRTAVQTITATLSAVPAGADIVYGSLDNGISWVDVTSKVSGTTLTWNGVTLAGSNTLLLRVVDAAGNVGANTSQVYTLDTAAPPTPGTPMLHIASDTGSSNSDRSTSDTTPTLIGSADDGSTVSIYDGATLLGTTVAGAGGWSFTSGVLGNGSHSLTAVATDTAGNVSAASGALSVTIDTSAPATASVTVPASGTYYTGQALDFAVNFNEAVSVDTGGGRPRIALVVGATTRYADYLSGSGSSALTFRYVVPNGDSDSNGITVGALSANGGSLKDTAGNDATLTLNSVGSTVGINVDGSQPSVTGVSASTADGAYRSGQIITLTVDFSSAVTVSGGTPTLALDDGGSATYTGGSGTSTLSFSYTVTAGQNSADLDYSSASALALNGATIFETGGSHQAASLTLAAPGMAGSLGAAKAIVIDTVAPTATIALSDTSLTAGETSPVTITFSEAVSGFSNANLSVANGTLSAVTSADGGTTWTATLTPSTSVTDASNVITLNYNGVQDGAGNSGSGSVTSANYAVLTARALSYSATTLAEAAANDGSVTSTLTITLANATFSGADGSALGTVSNVPAGLTAHLTRTDATHARLSLTGKASAHANAQDISNLTVSFADADFAGSQAAAVAGATTTLAIDFADPVAAPPPPVNTPPLPPALAAAIASGQTVTTLASTSQDVASAQVSFLAPTSELAIGAATGTLAGALTTTTAGSELGVAAGGGAGGTGGAAVGTTGGAGGATGERPGASPLAPAQGGQGEGGDFQLAVASSAVSPTDGLVVNRGVADQSLASGSASQFAIPADAFATGSANAVVSLFARQSDGRPLPGWLRFDPATGKFEGQPPPGFAGEVTIRVTARDAQGHEAVITFKVKVGRASGGEGTRAQPERSGRAGLSEQLRLMGRPHPALDRLARIAALRNAA